MLFYIYTMQLKGYISVECIFKNKIRTLNNLWHFILTKLGLSYLTQTKSIFKNL